MDHLVRLEQDYGCAFVRSDIDTSARWLWVIGGGALTGNVTLAAVPMGASGPSTHAAGIVPDPGATLGATRYLREDASWAVPSGAGGGLTDPTTTAGDLIVRGVAATTRLGVGTNGQSTHRGQCSNIRRQVGCAWFGTR